MVLFLSLAVLLAGPAQPRQEGQPFRLAPGDFRWVPFTVRQTPVEVDCRFEVTQGGATVHAELLPMSDFRLFDRGREHATLAATPDGRNGNFRRLIEVSGQYAVVVINQRGAPPATVSLDVRTNVNRGTGPVAQVLSPRRRLVVIVISFAVFFLIVTWSCRKLIAAMRSR